MTGKGRLAPSPTGAQHLGNARTYLLAYWSARKDGDALVLRIEDVDSPRVKPWATEQAIDDLAWLGIDWDEGPFIQTERTDLYRNALDRMIAANLVFPCTCSRKDIQAAGSAPHFEHEGPVYPGTCAGWTSGEPIPESGTFCWRFRAGDQAIEFDDLVLGRQTCVPSQALGAFPITQKSGEPSYQLAVVVDDGAMDVTEVVRGNDLVASTFRQIELYRALQLEPPRYAHVPLVCGSDGRRLAKRHGDTRLSQYRERGIPASRIVTWAARSAGMIGENESVEAADQVIERFDWGRLTREDVVVDADRFV
jgi:glutamyl-tRNA synthetase